MTALAWTAGRWRPGDRTVAGLLLAVAVLLAPLVAVRPTLGLLGGAGLILVGVTALRPVPVVIAFAASTPLVVGLERGALVSGLRLNEVLMVPVLAGLTVAALRRWRSGERWLPALHSLDVVVLALAFTGSVTPLLWMYARSRDITTEDLMYALALWKLAVLYLMVRLFVRGERATRALLVSVVATSLLVGVLGVLQSVGFGPVVDLLGRLVGAEEADFDTAGIRATSTVGNPHGYSDLLVYAAITAAALGLSTPRRRTPLLVLAGGLALASLASGSFSAVVALLVGGIAFAVVTRSVKWLGLSALVLLPLAYVVLQPVIEARLDSLDPDTGLPRSWTARYGRLDNLQRYFWPELARSFNWVLGVRPTSRVPGEVRPWVYIESGYTWALWNGGLPLLVAAVVLVVVMLRTGRRLRALPPPGPALGIPMTVVGWVLAVLMLFDPHLTLRGGAEVLFVLLALAAAHDPPIRPVLDPVPDPALLGRG